MKDLKCCHVRFACLLLAVAALTAAACSAPKAMQNATGLPAASAPVTAAPTSMLAGARTPGTATQPATTTIPSAFDSPIAPLPSAGPTAIGAATLVGQPFTSPLETPLAPISGTWRVFTHPIGVSLKYPAAWEAVDLNQKTAHQELDVIVRPPNRIGGIVVTAYRLPSDQESTLYRHAGDTWTYGESPVYHVVWDKVVFANGLDWRLDITGYIDITVTERADLKDLARKGAINNGSLVAIHYDQEKELVIKLILGLDPDMLIALDEQGPDAFFSGRVRVFSEMLETVSIDP